MQTGEIRSNWIKCYYCELVWERQYRQQINEYGKTYWKAVQAENHFCPAPIPKKLNQNQGINDL